MGNLSCVGEPLKLSAAEPQPKDDRIGFAACVGFADVALPFRNEYPSDWAVPSAFGIGGTAKS